MERARRGLVTSVSLLCCLLLAGCPGDTESTATRDASTARSTATAETSETPPPTQPSPDDEPVRPALGGPSVRPDQMLATVRLLAGRIGPREATSTAFAEAAGAVQRRFESYGYDVTRQRFRVPAGVSWGVPVDGGSSANVVATPRGFDPSRRHRLVGAHLDTVPQAPGAEDNASGVAVLLELSRLAARPRGPGPALSTVFIAFGAEEPRGDGEALHHFGSTVQVRRLPARALVSEMVSLDRVGVGRVVPVCTGGRGPLRVRDDLLATARRLEIPASGCADNQSSDHWSYEQAGIAAARIGSTPYAEYHSPADQPGVPSRAQMRRVATLAWVWLRE